MITNEELRQQVADILKQAGINAVEVATSPVALERAAKTVTGLLPFVLRPLVKERIRGVILQIAERVPWSTTTSGTRTDNRGTLPPQALKHRA
jgi:hypothetical protein